MATRPSAKTGWVAATHYRVSLLLGRMMSAARYSRTDLVTEADGKTQLVRKQRRSFAPFAIAIARPAFWLMGTGTRVLTQRKWEARERELYQALYGESVRTDPSQKHRRALLLPRFPGQTLAELLDALRVLPQPPDDVENERRAVPRSAQAARLRAIELAVRALADLHQRGFTHADAMAENVVVDLEAGIARWIDFETEHSPGRRRPLAWRRADDLRALMATVLVRVPGDRIESAIDAIVLAYGDQEVTALLGPAFGRRRPLPFYLGQAPLSPNRYREIARLLTH